MWYLVLPESCFVECCSVAVHCIVWSAMPECFVRFIDAYNNEVPLFVLLLVLPPRFKVGLFADVPKLNAMMSMFESSEDGVRGTGREKYRP